MQALVVAVADARGPVPAVPPALTAGGQGVRREARPAAPVRPHQQHPSQGRPAWHAGGGRFQGQISWISSPDPGIVKLTIPLSTSTLCRPRQGEDQPHGTRSQQVHPQDGRGPPGRAVARPRAEPHPGHARAPARGAPRAARERRAPGARAPRCGTQDPRRPGRRGDRRAAAGLRPDDPDGAALARRVPGARGGRPPARGPRRRLPLHRARPARDVRRRGRRRRPPAQQWRRARRAARRAQGGARQPPRDEREPRGPVPGARALRPRPHRGGAQGQARPGHRTRRGDPARHPGALAPHEEQPRPHRRARRRQDRDRRGPGAPHRRGRRARVAARQAAHLARHRRDGRGLEVPR